MGIAILFILFVGAMLLLLHFVLVPTPKVVSKVVEEPQRVIYVPVFVPILEEPQPEPIDEEPYRNPIRPWEQKIIDRKMDEYLEMHPNSDFFKEHPEYVDAYLAKVDISELGLDVKED